MKIKVFAEHLIAQIVVFWAAFALYRIVFTNAHFTFVNNRGNNADVDLLTTLYYTGAVHTHLGAADVMPTSPLSRFFTLAHTLVTYSLGSSAFVDIVSSSPGFGTGSSSSGSGGRGGGGGGSSWWTR